MRMLTSVSSDVGAKAFLTPHCMKLMKHDDQTLEEYTDWAYSFKLYLSNEHCVFMIKPRGGAYEFHISVNPNSSKEDVYETFKQGVDVFKHKELVTVIADKYPRVSRYLCKRLEFEKSDELEAVNYDGIEYRQFLYTNKVGEE